jgi:hypothetical protein
VGVRVLRIWQAVAATSVLLSLFAAWYSLAPAVFVRATSGAGLEPLTVPLLVENLGSLPVYRVRVTCDERVFQHLADQTREHVYDTEIDGSWRLGHDFPVVNPRQQLLVQCPNPYVLSRDARSRIRNSGARVSVEVEYRAIWIVPLQKQRFEFIARRDAGGRFTWAPIGNYPEIYGTGEDFARSTTTTDAPLEFRDR